MYGKPKYDGDRLDHDDHVYGLLTDGNRIGLDETAMGLKWWEFKKTVIEPIKKGHYHNLTPVIASLCEQSGGQLQALVVEGGSVQISRDGPVYDLDPIIIASIEVSCDAGDDR